MSMIQVEGWREVGKVIPSLSQGKTQMLHTSLLLTSCRELDHMATRNCKAGSTTMHPAENSVIIEKKRTDTTRQLEIFAISCLIIDAQQIFAELMKYYQLRICKWNNNTNVPKSNEDPKFYKNIWNM